MSPLPQGGLRRLPGVTTAAMLDATNEIVLGLSQRTERTSGHFFSPMPNLVPQPAPTLAFQIPPHPVLDGTASPREAYSYSGVDS